jgi:hypothetical protein
MAYDLHIERMTEDSQPAPHPITLEDWKAAIAATEGVRLFAAEAHAITNPVTGETIRIRAREGDAEVFFPDLGEWRPAFRWGDGSAAFAARFEPGDRTHPVWVAAVALASHLGAVICGDGGEVYDPGTGKVQ